MKLLYFTVQSVSPPEWYVVIQNSSRCIYHLVRCALWSMVLQCSLLLVEETALEKIISSSGIRNLL